MGSNPAAPTFYYSDPITERPNMTLALGQMAPPIELADSDGNRWSLADHQGRSVVLIFHRHIH